MDITSLLTPEMAFVLVINIAFVQLVKKSNDTIPDKASPIVALLSGMVLSILYHNYTWVVDARTIVSNGIIIAFATVYTYETWKSWLSAVLSLAKKK